ncbi:hypothetical protein EMCRGX_G001679 [Ephydatia muelleri]
MTSRTCRPRRPRWGSLQRSSIPPSYSLTLALYHTNDPFEIPVSAPAGSIPFRSVLCRVKPANSHYNFIFWYVQHGAGGTLLSTTFGAPSANRQ